MDKDVLEFKEWIIHNEKRIENQYLVQDLRKSPIWSKLLYREYLKYLDNEKEESNGI